MPKNDKFIYEGFDKPDSNFFRLPKEWTNITADLNSIAEIKVVEYVLRHTWGYQEYGIVKKITTEEFMNGRKTKDGNRLDKGTGLAKHSVIDGLRKAISHGLLIEEIDASDKARVKKYYSLKMKESEGVGEVDQGMGQADVQNLHIGVQYLHIRGAKSSHRSEKDTLERNNNVNVKNGKSDEEIEYYAELIANKLDDKKSLAYYKIMCRRFDPKMLLEKAAEIMGDGGAKKPGAVFSRWVQKELLSRSMKFPGS